jgi:predicted DCC family thiol-disulfide oxidoreductase YuxK
MKNDDDRQQKNITEVMFDGACPLCRREIAIYRQLQVNATIDWVDVSACDFQPPAGTTKEQLLERFHLITPDGELLSGAEAFVFLWNRLPGWRWLGFFANFPGMMRLMEWLYRRFLIVRPALQKCVRFFD